MCVPKFCEYYRPHNTPNVLNRELFCSRSFKPLSAVFLKGIFECLYAELPWQPLNHIYTCWLTSGKCTCEYKHSSQIFKAVAFTPVIQKLGEQIASTVGHPAGFNSCNANLYMNGKHALGLHSDDEILFGKREEPKLIVSFSLGAARNFNIFVKKEDLTFTIKLINGEIVTMEGLFQLECKHGVPAQVEVEEPRINLTYRNIVNHQPNCPCSTVS